MFESHIFKEALAHRYDLFTIMRQDPRERQFLECLKEIRVGHCSESSSRFISFLSRSLKIWSR